MLVLATLRYVWWTPFQRDLFSRITIWVLDKTQTFSAEVNGHQLNALLLWREFAYKHGYNINQNTPIFALCITSKYKRPCYWFWNQALSFYPVEPLYKDSYYKFQLIFLSTARMYLQPSNGIFGNVYLSACRTTLKGKHCWHPIAVMEVVNTFGHCVLKWNNWKVLAKASYKGSTG